MKRTISQIKQKFISSIDMIPQYLVFHKLFKKEFTTFLSTMNCSGVQINKPNYFDISGFFTHNNEFFYFSLGDLRWNKDELLIRQCRNYSDFIGYENNYLKFDNFQSFEINFNKLMEIYQKIAVLQDTSKQKGGNKNE